VKEFNYLGLLLTKTGNFKRAIKTLADKGTKAMYEILKRGKFHNLSSVLPANACCTVYVN
jgi:hypothetical protein